MCVLPLPLMSERRSRAAMCGHARFAYRNGDEPKNSCVVTYLADAAAGRGGSSAGRVGARAGRGGAAAAPRPLAHSVVRFVGSFFRSFFRSFIHFFILSFVRSFVRSFFGPSSLPSFYLFCPSPIIPCPRSLSPYFLHPIPPTYPSSVFSLPSF